MKRIALTGGIACGKSLVARYLNELGVETIDADDVAHELIPDPAERKRLAVEVFADPAKRRALEARLHPLIRERLNAFLLSASGGKIRLAVIPLLFETHWDAEYDIICAVSSAREVQIDRMMTTRGYTRVEAEERIAAQMPVPQKVAKSHYVIANDGSAAELRVKVAGFVSWLQQQIQR